ncbi:Cytochrome P450 CYP82H23 [Vitis vinifera]|uniref:Cytochrome P450 CYP82H23 n=1 Tax=Vitis vinifera TaxID=29760 RepID=A0A438CAY7_VITVI|nr:Cytochrome P450 CYP82H23 [Vitis vinifera]
MCATKSSVVNAKGNKKKGKRPPEPSGRWPLIGHLHLLGADKLLHRTLGDMADKYGPILLRSSWPQKNIGAAVNRQLEMHKHVQDSEVKILIKELYGQWASNKDGPALVEMKERFGNLALNVVVRAIAGKRYFGTHACGDEPKRGKKAFEDFIILLGLFMVSDVIPFLGWLDTMKGFTAE